MIVFRRVFPQYSSATPKHHPNRSIAKAFATSSRHRSYALYDVDEESDHKLRATVKMPTPGLMFVSSRILDPSKTSDEKYNRFYNEEHLPDILNYNKAKVSSVALRYKNVNTKSTLPYLALYPLEDASFLQSPDLSKLVEDNRVSKTFDNTDMYEHIEFGLRPYEKIQTFEGYGHAEKSGDERGQTIICVAMEPAEGEDLDFDEWYRKQHLDMLSMLPHYRRTTRYKRLDDVKPRYLALHEYACKPDELSTEGLKVVVGTEWSKKILKEGRAFDRDVFQLIQAQGDTRLKL